MARAGPETPDQPRGQGMVEYGLMVGIISMLVIATFVALGPQIVGQFQQTFDDETVGEGQASISASIYGEQ